MLPGPPSSMFSYLYHNSVSLLWSLMFSIHSAWYRSKPTASDLAGPSSLVLSFIYSIIQWPHCPKHMWEVHWMPWEHTFMLSGVWRAHLCQNEVPYVIQISDRSSFQVSVVVSTFIQMKIAFALSRQQTVIVWPCPNREPLITLSLSWHTPDQMAGLF